MKTILVTDKPKLWEFAQEFTDVVPARTYLESDIYTKSRSFKVINLCNNYNYQSLGYYVSLLAQARGHRIMPTVLSIQDLKNTSLSAVLLESIIDDIQKSLAKIKSDEFQLSIYFGKNLAKQYEKLSRKLYNLFQAPLFRVTFIRKKIWVMKKVNLINITDVPDSHIDFLQDAAKEFFEKKRLRSPSKKNYTLELAILVNNTEQTPPSNKAALKKFIKAGDELGIQTDIIAQDDYRYIGEYDALFIRETTAVNHHTYRFARRAAADGLIVIDDPQSILKCTNKVYLAELLNKHKIKTPITKIIHRQNWEQAISETGLPCILKSPDSSFSQGVSKVESAAEYEKTVKKCLHTSDLVIAQSYMPTAFDWRIGVFDNQPLFACRYYMAKDHWQIYEWQGDKKTEGDFDVVNLEEVPKDVLSTALKATSLIGDSLYGVDLKQHNDSVYVIEVNDNPNIDAGVEDSQSGDMIYTTIMQGILNRARKAKGLF